MVFPQLVLSHPLKLPRIIEAKRRCAWFSAFCFYLFSLSRIYQRKVDVDMVNAVKSVLDDVLSVSPSSELRGDYGLGESLYKVRAY